MRLEIERSALLDMLQAVDAVVPSRTTIPILNHTKMSANGRLEIEGTSLDRWLRAGAEAAIGEPGVITLPAAKLRDIARSLADGSRIKIEIAEGRARISSGRSRYSLPLLPPEEFPAMSEISNAITFRIGAPALALLLKTTRHAIYSKDDRPFLNGVWIDALHAPDGVVLRAFASDGLRFARRTMVCPRDAVDLQPVSIPPDAVANILKLIDGIDGEVELEINNERIALDVGPKRLVLRQLEAKPLAWDQFLPGDTSKHRMLVDRAELIAALARCQAISDDIKRGMRIRLTADGLALDMHSGDNTCTAEDHVHGELQGEPVDILINPRFLAEALDQLTAEVVRLGQEQPGSVVEILAEREPDVILGVMPMKKR